NVSSGSWADAKIARCRGASFATPPNNRIRSCELIPTIGRTTPSEPAARKYARDMPAAPPAFETDPPPTAARAIAYARSPSTIVLYVPDAPTSVPVALSHCSGSSSGDVGADIVTYAFAEIDGPGANTNGLKSHF